MPLFCDIDSNLNFTIEIMIDTDIEEQDLSQLFKNTIVSATKINKRYDHLIDKEGRILGQERIQLIEALDNLFVLLVILRIRLEKSLPADISLKDEMYYKVPIKIKVNKFAIHGKLKKDDPFKIENFSEGYEGLIFNKIKEMLMKYQDAVKDEHLQINKFAELYLIFDDILYNSIVMRYNLEICLIDR